MAKESMAAIISVSAELMAINLWRSWLACVNISLSNGSVSSAMAAAHGAWLNGQWRAAIIQPAGEMAYPGLAMAMA